MPAQCVSRSFVCLVLSALDRLTILSNRIRRQLYRSPILIPSTDDVGAFHLHRITKVLVDGAKGAFLPVLCQNLSINVKHR